MEHFYITKQQYKLSQMGGWVQDADKESDDILTLKNMWKITAGFNTIYQ